ncbi:MAG: hypothetical protein LBM05_02415 [Endomicrobium sp.]|jgi:hypothetical protein|nr:hypothetical protein [Endomicrobium sp.]
MKNYSCKYPVTIKLPNNATMIGRCRKCLPCLVVKTMELRDRIFVEVCNSPRDTSFLVTLTYNGVHLCDGNGFPSKVGSLYQPDISEFIKRLKDYYYCDSSDRRVYPFRSIKYHYTAEYGGSTNRPHYHVLLIVPGLYDMDEYRNKNRREVLLEFGSFLRSLWYRKYRPEVIEFKSYAGPICRKTKSGGYVATPMSDGLQFNKYSCNSYNGYITVEYLRDPTGNYLAGYLLKHKIKPEITKHIKKYNLKPMFSKTSMNFAKSHFDEWRSSGFKVPFNKTYIYVSDNSVKPYVKNIGISSYLYNKFKVLGSLSRSKVAVYDLLTIPDILDRIHPNIIFYSIYEAVKYYVNTHICYGLNPREYRAGTVKNPRLYMVEDDVEFRRYGGSKLLYDNVIYVRRYINVFRPNLKSKVVMAKYLSLQNRVSRELAIDNIRQRQLRIEEYKKAHPDYDPDALPIYDIRDTRSTLELEIADVYDKGEYIDDQ